MNEAAGRIHKAGVYAVGLLKLSAYILFSLQSGNNSRIARD